MASGISPEDVEENLLMESGAEEASGETKASSTPDDPNTNNESRETHFHVPRFPLESAEDLEIILERMHDRCVSRNLQAAGLGNLDADDDGDTSYGKLDPNAEMTTGETLLIACVMHITNPEQQYRYMMILLSDGANTNAQDTQGKTALMHACALGFQKTAKLILRSEEVDVFMKDQDGNTALHYLAAYGRSQLLKSFLKKARRVEKSSKPNSAGADDILEMKNHYGETASSLADRHLQYNCAAILKDEKLRKMKFFNRQLNLLQHSRLLTTPSFPKTTKNEKKPLHRFNSFDSLTRSGFDVNESSDDELLGSQPGTDFSKRAAHLKNEMKYQSQPSKLCQWSGAKDQSNDKDQEKEKISVNAAFTLSANGSPILRTRKTSAGSKPEMIPARAKPQNDASHSALSPKRKTSLPAAPLATDLGPPKRGFTDRIRNFLRRKPRNYALTSAETMPNIAPYMTNQIDQPKPEDNRNVIRRRYSQQNPKQIGDPKMNSTSVLHRNSNIDLTIKASHDQLPNPLRATIPKKNLVKHPQISIEHGQNRSKKQQEGHSKQFNLPPIRNAHLLEKYRDHTPKD